MGGSRESDSCPIRIAKTSRQRFEPYGEFGDWETKHQNAEAGPSTLPMLEPTGGLTPETTANAEATQTIGEEDETLVSGFYHSHVPRSIDWSILHQNAIQRRRARAVELRRFVERWKGLNYLPSEKESLKCEYMSPRRETTHLTRSVASQTPSSTSGRCGRRCTRVQESERACVRDQPNPSRRRKRRYGRGGTRGVRSSRR